MSINDAFITSTNALYLANLQTNIISKNIANASTDGYQDKIFTSTIGSVGTEYKYKITTNVNQYLNQQFNDTTSIISKKISLINI
jgi:flagellar basal body rod protein FlgB